MQWTGIKESANIIFSYTIFSYLHFKGHCFVIFKISERCHHNKAKTIFQSNKHQQNYEKSKISATIAEIDFNFRHEANKIVFVSSSPKWILNLFLTNNHEVK